MLKKKCDLVENMNGISIIVGEIQFVVDEKMKQGKRVRTTLS